MKKHLKAITRKLRESLRNIKKERGKKALSFFLILILFSTPIYIIEEMNIELSQLQEITTRIVEGFLSTTGFSSEIVSESPYILGVGDSFFLINNSCTGYKSLLIFVGLIAATPNKKLREKIKGLVLTPVIFFGNISRIYITSLLVSKGYISFNLIHNLLWQGGLFLIVLATWIYWVRFMPEFEN